MVRLCRAMSAAARRWCRRRGRARRGQRAAGGADGAHGAAGRAALAQLPRLVQAAGLTVALLSGSQPARTRRSAFEAIASGEIRIVVGTHALFQEGVDFANLALVIVDEQHRFGVQQRLRLQEKGSSDGRFPHQLIMTATPIPRTLAMTAYADLDISVIDELPPGPHAGARPWSFRSSGATKSSRGSCRPAGRAARRTGSAR